jgi:hypothetical protein
MTDTTYFICDSLSCNQTGLLTLAIDTLKVLNVPSNSTGFNWSDFFKPSIDLIIAVIGASVIVWQYLVQKQKESTERIIESKKIAYAEFLKDFTETAVKIMHEIDKTGSYKQDRDRLLARNQLLLYANDKVIKAYHDWIEYADTDKHDINREVELFGIILLEIRKDIHGNSKVTEQEISNLNPFNRG